MARISFPILFRSQSRLESLAVSSQMSSLKLAMYTMEKHAWRTHYKWGFSERVGRAGWRWSSEQNRVAFVELRVHLPSLASGHRFQGPSFGLSLSICPPTSVPTGPSVVHPPPSAHLASQGVQLLPLFRTEV